MNTVRLSHFFASLVGSAVLVIALLLLLLPLGAQAGSAFAPNAVTRYVSPDGACGGASPCYSTIQAAVSASAFGDKIMVSASTYFEHVTIGVSITIQGVGGPAVNGGGGGTVITITNGTSVIIMGLTVTNGHGTDDGMGNFFGGGIINSGTLQLINSTVTGNSTTGTTSQNGVGGGIYSGANSTLILSGSIVLNNSANGGAGSAGSPFGGPGGNAYGGGIYGGTGSSLFLINSTINNNSAHGANSGAPIGIQGGSAYGGGIYTGISSTLTLSTTNVRNNSVTTGLGINSGGGFGGGINNNGVMALVGCTIDGNQVIGADNTGGDNGGGAYGGGVFSASTNGAVTITQSTLSNNLAQGGNSGSFGTMGFGSGGGIHNASTQLLMLDDTTISGNSVHGGSGTVQDGDGGGIYNGASSKAILNNVTLYNNNAEAGGPGYGYGGAIWNGGTLTLTNSIAAGSLSGGGCFGTIRSGGYNLSSDASCSLTAIGDITNTNPLLDPLQNNGGSTQTHAPQTGSPAVDAGNPATPGSGSYACLSTDQRGIARSLDGNGDTIAICDIGAIEMQPLLVGGARYVSLAGDDTANACASSFSPCRTVQHAIDVSQDGDEIHVAQGTYTNTLGTVALITKSIALQGGWNDAFATHNLALYPTTLDGQRMNSVILITSPITTTPIAPTIDSFIVTHGLGQYSGCPTSWVGSQCGGGIASQYAIPIIVNNVITDNFGGNGVDGNGGGIWLFGGGTPAALSSSAIISHNVVISNVANVNGGGYGGGMAMAAAHVMLINNQIVSNTASTVGEGAGGGVLLETISSYGLIQNNVIEFNVGSAITTTYGAGLEIYYSQADVISNSIRYNTSRVAGIGSIGGGVMIVGSAPVVTLTDNVIGDNLSHGRGGGIFISVGSAARVSMDHNDILSNTASTEGGGIWTGGPTTVADNLIAYNHAITPTEAYGGGISIQSGPVTVTNNQIHHNTVPVDSGGAGIYLGGSNTTAFIQQNEILYNSGGDGGGIWPCGVATVTVDSNLIAYNTSYASWGSAVRYCSSQLVSVTLSNNVIVSNTGNGVSPMQNVRVVNNTIAYNSQHGLSVGLSQAPLVINNLFYKNGDCGVDGGTQGISILDYNDSWGNSSAYCSATPGPNSISVDPQLVNAEAGDYHIRFGSPTMNRGTNIGAPLYDKDGVVRPQMARMDMGAYEVVAPHSVYLPTILK
jgi:fibronectin-binding autotransporter adhesin